MSSPTSYLVFDIETVPDGSVWTRPAATQSVADGAFPPPYAHQTIVIGGLWLDAGYRARELTIFAEGGDERAMLTAFSEFVDRHRPALVTYNGRAFDLPVIALRALRHGVALPWYYGDSGLRDSDNLDDHIDLCARLGARLAEHGTARSGSLDALARLIGLPGKQGIDGSQVEGLYRAGRLADIQRYCLSDVVQTALLFLRFRLLQGVFARDEYRAHTSALTSGMGADARLRELMQAVDDARLLAA